MIIDTHVHISNGAHPAMKQPAYTAEELLDQMNGPYAIADSERRVDMALCQNHPHDTVYETDVRVHHQYVADSVAKYRDRLLGCMVVNPRLGVDLAVSVLRELVSSAGFRALKLHPTTHGFYPERSVEWLRPILQAATDLEIPVIVHTGDPPFSQPVQVAPIAAAFPKLSIILAHLGSQQVSYAHQAIYVARMNPNVYLETGWGTLARLRDAVDAIGPSRLVNASDCPLLEMGSQLRLLEILGWSSPFGLNLAESALEDIMGNNAARLLGVS
jgi:hypothetical protein